MANDKNISYLNKSFSDFKTSLLNHAKTYFPTVYNDFSDASPGMMFIEMGAYVGDVLSFYLDTQFQENLLLYTKEKSNALAMSYVLGYRPKVSYASNVELEISQLVPIISSGDRIIQQSPDDSYYMRIPINSKFSSTTGVTFITLSEVDFAVDKDREISFFSSQYYLITKKVQAISAEIKSQTINFGTTPQKFASAIINDDKILQILRVTDSYGDIWYEVPYLAQETVINKTSNLGQDELLTPYLLNYTKVNKRFVTRFQPDNSLELQFGSGVSSVSDETLLPNPQNIGIGTISNVYDTSNTFNKANIVVTKEYGLAPTGNLTVEYLVGGGIESICDSNTIINIGVGFNDVTFNGGVDILSSQQIFSSLTVTNPLPSVGGRDGDTVEEIRQNSLHSFAAQNRAVNKEDYMNRVLSMPSDFGSVAKIYVEQDAAIDSDVNDKLLNHNPLSISMYLLSYDINKNVTIPSETLKTNVSSYLSNYKMLTDAINIKNAYYINIGVNFEITALPSYNNREVLNNCLLALKEFFSIDKWQINQPIVISDITTSLLKVKGVQSVIKIQIINKQGGDYSPYGYDIPGATRNNIIYPSLDPAIFEVKFPDNDIAGRVVAI
jgi:hypothetical protein